MKNKRSYIKPLLEVHKVDHTISLVMTSDDTPPGPGGPPPSGQSAETLQQNNFESNPFDETK